jgi:DHA1 family tetracycline resistance protein-like MFS transporter
MTTEENRAAGLGKIGAAMGLGFIFGPAIGGLLAGAEVETANYMLPALAAAALSVVATLGGIFFLRESLAAADRKPLSWSRATPAGAPPNVSLAAVNRQGLLKLFIAALIFYTAMSQMESIFPLWANDLYAMGPRYIGGIFFYLGTVVVIMQAGMVGPLTRRFGDRPVAIASGVFFAIGLGALATLDASWQVWIALLPFGIGVGLFNPTVSSIVSKACSANERGAVMGKYQAANAWGRFFGPLWSGLLYSKISMAAPFAVAAVLMLPALLLVALYRLSPAEQGADAI